MAEKKQLKVSRRRFLKDATVLGGAVVGAGTLAGVEAIAATPAAAQAPLPKAMGYVSYNPENCAGCRTCMAVCSLYHDGFVSADLARIQVVAPVLKLFEAEGVTCKQCDSPACLAACPAKAIGVDPKTGARVIDAAKCVGCRICIQACVLAPNSPIRYDAVAKKCVKCDLCSGDPQCIKFCPKSVSVTPHLYPQKDHVLRFVKAGEIPLPVLVTKPLIPLPLATAVTAQPISMPGVEVVLTLSGSAAEINPGGVEGAKPIVSETPTGVLVTGTVFGGHQMDKWEAKVQAQIYDAAGKLLGASEPLTFKGLKVQKFSYELKLATRPSDVKKCVVTIVAVIV